MTPKEKALEMVNKNFYILSKALNYKGLKKERDEKKFYAIEKLAKDCSIIGVDSCVKHIEFGTSKKYWEEVKQEIENL